MLISGYSFLSLVLSAIIKLIFVVVYLERLDVCQCNKFSLICHLSPNAVVYLSYPSKSALSLLSKAKSVWELGPIWQLWKSIHYQLLRRDTILYCSRKYPLSWPHYLATNTWLSSEVISDYMNNNLWNPSLSPEVIGVVTGSNSHDTPTSFYHSILGELHRPWRHFLEALLFFPQRSMMLLGSIYIISEQSWQFMGEWIVAGQKRNMP